MIDLTKQYVTRADGWEVRLAGLDTQRIKWPIVGFYIRDDGHYVASSWTKEGRIEMDGTSGPMDLVEKPRTVEIPEQLVTVNSSGLVMGFRNPNMVPDPSKIYKLPAQTLTEVKKD